MKRRRVYYLYHHYHTHIQRAILNELAVNIQSNQPQVHVLLLLALHGMLQAIFAARQQRPRVREGREGVLVARHGPCRALEPHILLGCRSGRLPHLNSS